MIKRIKMFGFFVLLPTYYQISHYASLLCVPFILYRAVAGKTLSDRAKVSLFFLVIIVIFSYFNQIFGFFYSYKMPDIMPYTLLHFITFFAAFCLKEKDLKAVLFFIFIEALVVILELFLMVNTIFTSHPDFKKFTTFSYLYFFRPFGLSSGSTTVAFKLLVGIILLDRIPLSKKVVIILRCIFCAALIINFNRTTLIAVFCYWLIRNDSPRLIIKKILLLLILIIFLINSGFIDIFYDQFFRGNNTIDLSYRDVIWKQSFEFIVENPIFGNFSSKFYTVLDVYNELEHAHNSFIQILATNGIAIFIIYLLFIFINLKKYNLKYIVPFLIISMYQYGIFWGISFLDIIFYKFLIFDNVRLSCEDIIPCR